MKEIDISMTRRGPIDSIHFPILTDEERLLPLVVTTVGSWTNQLETIRPHGYPDYQWLQCTTGRGMFQWEGGGPAVEIGPGQGYCCTRMCRMYISRWRNRGASIGSVITERWLRN